MEILKDIGRGLKAGVINISPEQAQKMLERNNHNRPIKKGKISHYAIDMEEGLWQLNGIPIIFNGNGELLDGQNRLHAIIRSGVSCEVVVISGVTREAFKTIDTGSNRTGKDVLAIHGLPSEKAGRLTALIQKIFAQSKDRRGSAWGAAHNPDGRYYTPTIGSGDASFYNDRQKLPNQLILKYYIEHEIELNEVYDFCIQYDYKIKKIIPFPLYLLMFYTLRKLNIKDAEIFCSSLATGEMLASDSPIYQLREKLISFKNNPERIPGWHYAGLTFKAWNNFRKRKPIQKLFIAGNEKEPVRPI